MKTEFNVKGMTCKACEMLIDEALEDVGAASVSSDHATGRVVVEHEESLTADSMKRVIAEEGFEAERP